MTDAYIYDAVRTPRGKGSRQGGLHSLSPLELTSVVLKALDQRTGFSKGSVDDVILGNAESVNDQGANLARSAVLYAGLPETIPGSMVSRFCGSGLDAVNLGAARIMSGQADMIVSGGIEMMSLVPIAGTGGPSGSDTYFNDAAPFTPLGIAADALATVDGHSRRDVDAYAAESQTRAERSWREGRFSRSIIPVRDMNGDLCLDRDEHMRPGSTIESLGKLKPAFIGFAELGFDLPMQQRYPEIHAIDHVHTAGNSSGVVDGAAAVLLGTRAAGEAIGLKPRARIAAFATLGTDPGMMLTAPVDVSRKCARRAGMELSDVDLVECNEAFAAVVLRFLDRSGLPSDRVNPNGGAIAMGHPIGASGPILIGTLLDEMERQGARTGLVTMCVGLGMGVATLIERV